jgi:hypothetical protein
MGMYGADVEQLRALARSFDSAATRLDQNRMTVGNAIRIQAWVGPVAVRFRGEWDSVHSVKVAGAAARLRDAASVLRRNADDQDRTSTSDGGVVQTVPAPGPPLLPWTIISRAIPGLVGVVAGSSLGSLLGEFAGGTNNMLKGIVGAIELPTSIAEMGHTAAHVLMRGKGSDAWTTFGAAAEATKLGRVLGAAGTTLGVISAGFGAYETVAKALEGDTEGAIYSGVKTLIGAAAVIPSPIQPFAAALSIGIGVGELLSQNPAISNAVTNVVVGAGESIARGASDVANAVGKVADGVGKAAGSFLDGVGKAAKKLWPW